MTQRYTGLDVPTLLAARARERGAHPFLVWAPFEGPVRTWSYAQFADKVTRIAGGLAARRHRHRFDPERHAG